jgi:hypothetical protein
MKTPFFSFTKGDAVEIYDHRAPGKTEAEKLVAVVYDVDLAGEILRSLNTYPDLITGEARTFKVRP